VHREVQADCALNVKKKQEADNLNVFADHHWGPLSRGCNWIADISDLAKRVTL